MRPFRNGALTTMFQPYLFRSLFSPAGGQGAVFSQKGAASVGENQESIRLLHTIRNMLIGIGLMVSALGLLAFGYLFAEGTNLLQPCSSSAPCCF